MTDLGGLVWFGVVVVVVFIGMGVECSVCSYPMGYWPSRTRRCPFEGHAWHDELAEAQAKGERG